ncbi:putative ubiquitin-specific processing protease 21 [Zopfochytrium polystomum]|nr:putative ubiquitin-specific processing protease 21 [Zopfochytrium polystomum]
MSAAGAAPAAGAVPAAAGPQTANLEDVNSLLPDIGLDVEDSLVYKWKIDSWSALKVEKRAYSPEFSCLGTRWRILLFPNGNQQNDTLSVFLDSVEASIVPKNSNWHICVQFALAIANPDDQSVFKASTAQHRYNPTEADWGFNHLVKLSQLTVATESFSRPLVENDKTVIVVHMKIMKDITGVLWHKFVNYDSKKETGFIGLKNQGATCYMNSILQSLFFTSFFRKAVYSIPTDQDIPSKSIALALQRVFFQLQLSGTPVGTTELTKSFGWNTLDSFMQHDVQEFNRVLQDNLESKMKGTKAEGAISRLFVGEYKSFIKCINVDYESSRVENFYDIQLNVKGFKSVRESFADYISEETLDGDNKYDAAGFGLQAAKKGVIFQRFPPVLHLQLKRFEYDIERDAMVKINDWFEFPERIDLGEFLEKAPQTPQNYILHGVLVHTGDVTGGHYCAFLKVTKDGKWLKFDDDRVTPVTMKDVLESNYGVNPNVKASRATKKFTNAYMLVYMRESDLDEILGPISEDDVPQHLRRRFEDEQILLEQKRREKEEQHLFINVKVLLDEHIKAHRGFDLCNFDDKSAPLTPVHHFKVRRDETLAQFKKLNTASNNLRIWTMVGRQNRTVRPDCLVLDSDSDKSMDFLHDKFSKNSFDLRLYVETGPRAKEDLTGQTLIFLKYYDPLTLTIEYKGNVLVRNRTQRITEIFPTLLERAALPSGTPLLLFEEIKPDMVDPLKPKSTFSSAELGDGDIICYQRELTSKEIALVDPDGATVQKYFDTQRNRQSVLFKPKQFERTLTESPEIELSLSKKMTYDQVVTKLGEKLGCDPMKLRLSTTSATSTKQAIKRTPILTLQEMLQIGFFNPIVSPAILYYEQLEVSILELDTKSYFRIILVDKNFKEKGPFDVLVPKTGTAVDILEKFKEKSKLTGLKNLRLVEVMNYKIQKVLTEEDGVPTINENSNLYAEETPAEELNMGEGDVLCSVFHYNRDPGRPHGIPFKFVLFAEEKFSATKTRLLDRIGYEADKEKEISKVRFYIVPSGFTKPTLISDGKRNQ